MREFLRSLYFICFTLISIVLIFWTRASILKLIWFRSQFSEKLCTASTYYVTKTHNSISEQHNIWTRITLRLIEKLLNAKLLIINILQLPDTQRCVSVSGSCSMLMFINFALRAFWMIYYTKMGLLGLLPSVASLVWFHFSQGMDQVKGDFFFQYLNLIFRCYPVVLNFLCEH